MRLTLLKLSWERDIKKATAIAEKVLEDNGISSTAYVQYCSDSQLSECLLHGSDKWCGICS